ncbi:hypothetical protein CKAH01_15935 [Colletotrichum kahawae]|uniref:Uncharacterized protein n=1 Tax=Colletotrichum kahawae TaxID=34407 RepID=A0AAD9YGX3_COLKA|nr:hypothetical protein CKAH01_15935 [Colletotrichum kahawae]
MNLKLNVSKEAWKRWKDVIHDLSKPPYDFPASNQDEFSLFLRMFSGTGTTFRISRDRWKFVIDVLRIANDIIDIVAITVIAHTIQDERHNGFVITKACRLHLNKDTKSPGSPELKWHMVTSGGEAYHHCCDKECIGPDRVNKRKLNWESTRLNIIQKAFEQEVLELRRENMFFAADMRKLEQKNSKNTDQKLRTQIQEQLRQLAESDHAVERHRNNNRITAEENARLRENGRIMAEEIVDLRGQLKATGKQQNPPKQQMTRQQKLQERFDEVSVENMKLKTEVHLLLQSHEGLKASNLQLSSYNTELRARADEKKQNHEELEAARTQLKDRTKRLGKQIRHTQDRVTELKDASKKLKTAKAQLKVDLRNADDHNRLLESEVYYSRINEQKSFDKQTEHISDLEERIKLKDALIQQLQQNILHHQPQAPNQASRPGREELERQRHISREAHERASDLESKLDAMKAAMTDKTDEMASLEKEWSAKVAEADGMKRRYHDKDAYITNLETKLEELRGTMENVLGQVSMHQGRKRRRTEGPDFQL